MIGKCVFLLSHFLGIYQQSWKDENENGKVLDIVEGINKQGNSVGRNVFDPHTLKVGYRLKVVLLHLWRQNYTPAIRGFICLALGDFYTVKLAP